MIKIIAILLIVLTAVLIISPYQGIAEAKEMDEAFGTAITQSLYGDGRGGRVIELDNESKLLAEEYEGF